MFPMPFSQSKTYSKPPFSTHPYYIQLVDDLEKTKTDMAIIYANFENAVDPDLIDCCIYELNAAQKRYKFLLDRVKKLEMST